MITREQIEEVQAESRKRGISIKQTLQEKGISAHQYFRWKRRYAQEAAPAGFLPIADGGLPTGMSAAKCSAAPSGRQSPVPSGENWMTIELRTAGGSDMRIQGGLTPAMMYTILKSI